MNTRFQRMGPGLRALLAASVGLALGGGALVWTRTEITSLRMRLTDRIEAEAQLRDEVEKLRLEVAILKAPPRLEREARALGLRFPEPGQVAVLRAPPGEAGP